MTDVFISYSRKDKDFVKRLQQGLAAQKRDVWVDWEDIPPTADWWREIQGGIEAANAFVFVISPDSARSDVCRQEIEHALSLNKRFVPVLRREVTDQADQQLMHPSISSHNWIFFRDSDDFDAAFQSLIGAIDTDLSHVRAHTRLLVRAREWDANGRNSSFLLQGDDLRHAEEWLAQGMAKKPEPTDLHTAYILASRQAATARQRRLLAGVSVALVVALALAILSLGLFGVANEQKGIADVNAANAQTQAAIATHAQGQAQISAAEAQTQAAIATHAQGEAQVNAANAQTQAAIATAAQGQAQISAANAQTQAAIATVAQGQAQFSAATAAAGATAVSDANQQAQAVALAGQAQLELDGPLPERSVLLALAAFQGNRYTWQAERALALSVQPTLAQPTLEPFKGQLTSLDWSPDGRLLITGTIFGVTLVWDNQGNPRFTLENGLTTATITQVRWSPDGKLIATGSDDGKVTLWSVSGKGNDASANLLFTLSDPTISTAHSKAVTDLAWSRDSSSLASTSADSSAKIWDAATGSLIATFSGSSGHKGDVLSASWSPDGSRLVTVGSDHTAKIWDVASGTAQPTSINSSVLAVWSPDGTMLATAGTNNAILIWQVNSGEVSLRYTLTGHLRTINRLAFSGDSTRLASASDDDTAKIWDARNGVLLRNLFGHLGNVTDLTWTSSTSNPRLLTASSDHTIRMWNTDFGGELLVFSGHGQSINLVEWAPNGEHIAALKADGTVQIWQSWISGPGLVNFARRCCIERILTDEENIQFGLPTATVPPTSLVIPTALPGCENTLPPRLYPQSRGIVSDEDPTSVNVRLFPGTTSARIGQIAPGQTFQVLNEPPRCQEGLYWYHIIYGIGAAQGWIAEGQSGVYFVEPVR